MICINEKCQKCKLHFVNQKRYKKCYSSKEFIRSCDELEENQELNNTKFATCVKEGGKQDDRN